MIHFVVKVLKSFTYAAAGVVSAFHERNMKVHGAAAGLVVLLGLVLGLSWLEWVEVFLLIGMVWSAEMFNTAIEELANIVRDELKLSYAATRRARDLAAGAVLVVAVIACVIGLRIFVPKMLAVIG